MAVLFLFCLLVGVYRVTVSVTPAAAQSTDIGGATLRRSAVTAAALGKCSSMALQMRWTTFSSRLLCVAISCFIISAASA